MSAAENKPRAVVLRTGLFPDRGTVEDALDALRAEVALKQIDLELAQMDQAQWDKILEEILAAERIITI